MAGFVNALDWVADRHCRHRIRCFVGQAALWSALIFVVYEVSGTRSALRPLLGFCWKAVWQ